MTIACIACGGILETTLIVMGLGVIIRWPATTNSLDLEAKSC